MRQFFDSWVQDSRHAVRSLFRNPGFVALAILTLALGIGANTAIFSVVYGILLRPLPYHDADRLVLIQREQDVSGARRPVPFPFSSKAEFTSGGRKGSHAHSRRASNWKCGFLTIEVRLVA